VEQDKLSKINQQGWNQAAYQAWINRHGLPIEYAKELKENPEKAVSHYLQYMGDVRGKKIVNFLGSKGSKAVSLALLGADVTVVDISKENRRYAIELAKEANVNIHYIVSDVLNIPAENILKEFDYVLLENGVLHYFIDLLPLFTLVSETLKKGGSLILRDYHPFVSKIIKVNNQQIIANGNYFDKELIEVDVAYSSLLNEKDRSSLKKNKIRKWNMGEVITTIAKTGLLITSLEEEEGNRWVFPKESPEGIENRLPGLYTLTAKK